MPPRKRTNANTDEEMMVTDTQTEQISEVFLQADSNAAKEAVLLNRLWLADMSWTCTPTT